jgi:UDP-N-acetylmuramate dehydrogenase
MIEIIYKKSLKQYNTFGIDVFAHLFSEVNSEKQLTELLLDKELRKQPLLIMGGGSNLLFTGDVDGIVVKINLLAKEILSENEETVLVRAAAGENWDEFVAWTVEQGFSGLENLSLIPGVVGSCPIQNIGAYAVEVKDYVSEVEIIYLDDCKKQVLDKESCRFGYRDSIFKNELKGKAVIVSVSFLLNKKYKPELTYGAIAKELSDAGILRPGPADVREAVCRIRRSKLPDPAILGNAGSFFKNPVVSSEKFESMSEKFPGIPAYHQDNGMYKLAAGWLIEQCGWKGVRRGNAGVHEKQALVLVNYGNATGNEILALADEIKKSVMNKFGVELQTEVNIL